MTPIDTVHAGLAEHADVAERMGETCAPEIAKLAVMAAATLSAGGKILLFGNGGSAAEAQHIAAELTGKFRKDRTPWPAIALSTDTSALTAIANDYGYDLVFRRQLEALARRDLCIGISTSGRSMNVITACHFAHHQAAAKVAALTGADGMMLSGFDGAKVYDLQVQAPSTDTARIQEMHTLIGHAFVEALEGKMGAGGAGIAGAGGG